MAVAVIKGLCKTYCIAGRDIKALVDIDFRLEKDRIIAIVGKSGSGKTTLLRVLMGLEQKTSGEIQFAAQDTKIGIVFQEPRLMPWLTVEENIALGFQSQLDQSFRQERIAQYLHLLGLVDFKNAYPNQISGGMAQRVALGRALCYDPNIILMDEPLSALDAFTRRKLQQDLVSILLGKVKSVLFVTHDIEEAIFLASKVIVMDQGKMIREFPVPLSYPRNRSDSAFYELRNEIMQLLEMNQ